MSDDIVTRLLASDGMTVSRASDGLMGIHPDTELMREGADEIEHLRADRDRWRNIADGLYQWAIGILGDHMTIEPVKQYEKAVRGE